jgi:hypothetical protein
LVIEFYGDRFTVECRRARTDDEPLRGVARDLFAPCIFLRRERPTARLRRHRDSGRPELARLFALLPVFQRR